LLLAARVDAADARGGGFEPKDIKASSGRGKSVPIRADPADGETFGFASGRRLASLSSDRRRAVAPDPQRPPEGESQDQDAERTAPPREHDELADTLLDPEFVTSRITVDDPWCVSHGSGEDSTDLGAGILYYALAYAHRARTCVCLGSGGGFVPRLMRQAQRDLGLPDSRTFLVDAAGKVSAPGREIWGRPCWAEEDSTFRRNFPEVEIRFQLTEDAFREYFEPEKLVIDYLHIDADHHYEGAKLDWDLYSTLVAPDGVITLHDTVNYREPCGVPRLVEEIGRDDRYQVIDFPISFGTAIVRKAHDRDATSAASGSGLPALTGRR
jgi:hypothetical protein